jgi:hypothetical protein
LKPSTEQSEEVSDAISVYGEGAGESGIQKVG